MKRGFLLACAAALALLLGTAGAYFTGETMVQDNVISAGSVAVSAEPTAAALSIDALAPGQTVTRPLAVANCGTLPCTVVVTGAKKAGITAFYEALECTVTHEGSVVYGGPVTGLRTLPVNIDVGGREELRFTVSLPADVGNDLAGDYVKLTLYVGAEQVH